MKRILSTGLAIVLLLGLGTLAVLARPGGADILASPRLASVPAAPVLQVEVKAPVAAPDAPAIGSTQFNWVALPLHDATLVMASDLKAHMEANSNGSITVVAVEQWNSIAQNYQTYSTVPFPNGDFALAVGGVYRVAVTGNAGAQTVWSMVGDVPDPGEFSYTLRETAGSDFNWIMLPLQKGSVTMASGQMPSSATRPRDTSEPRASPRPANCHASSVTSAIRAGTGTASSTSISGLRR